MLDGARVPFVRVAGGGGRRPSPRCPRGERSGIKSRSFGPRDLVMTRSREVGSNPTPRSLKPISRGDVSAHTSFYFPRRRVMNVPDEVLEAAREVLTIDEVTALYEETEGGLHLVDGDNYRHLLREAEALARWVLKVSK